MFQTAGKAKLQFVGNFKRDNEADGGQLNFLKIKYSQFRGFMKNVICLQN